MSEFEAPSGPPPPKVPEGWKAQWNAQYSEWFYVNIYTKKSQWDKPTEPVYPPPANDSAAPPGAPPGYDHKTAQPTTEKAGGLTSNNPYGGNSSGPDVSEDERLARQLQAEEDAGKGAGSRGASDSYYSSGAGPGSGSSPYPPQSTELPPRPDAGGASRGIFGKMFGKNKNSNQQYPQQQSPYPQQPYPQQQQQPYGGGGYPPQGYGPPPPQQYGGGYGGGYPPPGGYGGGYAQQAPPRKSGGMGAMGGAALGLGGGLIGGMLIEDAIQDHDQNEYNEGYDQGQDNNDYGGGGDDYGGGDDGGDF